ncbi:MAG: hypothetical protein CMH55_08035 [Myxococcales bacterium]|nr:hypothetical protein [Myxococcales bacterium]
MAVSMACFRKQHRGTLRFGQRLATDGGQGSAGRATGFGVAAQPMDRSRAAAALRKLKGIKANNGRGEQMFRALDGRSMAAPEAPVPIRTRVEQLKR